MKFFIKNLVTFTEEILNGKLHFLCREINQKQPNGADCKIAIKKNFSKIPGKHLGRNPF